LAAGCGCAVHDSFERSLIWFDAQSADPLLRRLYGFLSFSGTPQVATVTPARRHHRATLGRQDARSPQPPDPMPRFPAPRAHLAAIASLLLATACALPQRLDPPSTPSPAASSPADAPTPLPDDEVRLLAINDFHGHLDPGQATVVVHAGSRSARLPVGGAAYLASLLHRLGASAPRSLVVASGDLVGASPLDSGLFGDEPTILALNDMGLSLSSVGNHEFDHGVTHLLRLQRGGCAAHGRIGKDTCLDGRFPGARFEYLAANVLKADGAPLLPPIALRSFRGPQGTTLRIGFIGIVLRGTPQIVKPSGIAGLRFADEARTINHWVPVLRRAGADAVIVLIHQGGYVRGDDYDGCNDLQGPITGIVRRLDPRVTAVLSAHTHQAYVCDLPSRDPQVKIPTSQAGSYGHFVTELRLRIDPVRRTASVLAVHNLPVINDTAPDPLARQFPALRPDPRVAALVRRYDAATAPITSRAVGHVADGGLSRRPDAAGESALGAVVADSQLAAARRYGAVAALMNPGGIREDLPAGVLRYGQAFATLPFGNRIVVLDLSGAQLHALLEAQWRRHGREILQVSRGLAYAWRADAPAGRHLVPGSLRIAGHALRRSGHYRIAVNDYLAGGGDGFTLLRDLKPVADAGSALAALVTYAGRHQPLTAPSGSRLRRVGTPQPR
jgi:5''-nucleotidase/2'',3''-cyclic phosphodiesterase and related esterases